MCRLVGLQFELVGRDLAVAVAVLVREHVVDYLVGVEAGGEPALAVVHLPQDVVRELQGNMGLLVNR